jgi:hypothetical protein
VSAGLDILRFGAGDLGLMVAAAGVKALPPPDPAWPHISEILGLGPPRPHPDRRALELEVGEEAVGFLVDGPLTFATLDPQDLLAPPPLLELGALSPIAGFVREGDRVGYVLDLLALCNKP